MSKHSRSAHAAHSYMMKNGDEVSGPFDRAARALSLRSGDLRPTVLVQAQGHSEWRPLSEVETEWRMGDAAPVAEDNGNFWVGFAIGLSTSWIGALITQILGTHQTTKRGAWFGFGLNFLIVIVCFVVLVLVPLQHVDR